MTEREQKLARLLQKINEGEMPLHDLDELWQVVLDLADHPVNTDYSWLRDDISKRMSQLARYPEIARNNQWAGKAVVQVMMSNNGPDTCCENNLQLGVNLLTFLLSLFNLRPRIPQGDCAVEDQFVGG